MQLSGYPKNLTWQRLHTVLKLDETVVSPNPSKL